MTGMTQAPVLRGGIIAAGLGSRLRADGHHGSKAMALVSGRPLIAHALDRFRAAGVREVSIIINETSDDCGSWLRDHAQAFDVDLIVRSTPSSYASFRVVADRLAHAPALVTTVDAIMPPDGFETFVKSAQGVGDDAVVLGLTDHVDDENPLWATIDSADGRIRRLGADAGSHVTAGLYWLPARMPAAPDAKFARLRDYLKWLVEEHQPVRGVVLPLVFDIDRARDIEAAEAMSLSRQHETAVE